MERSATAQPCRVLVVDTRSPDDEARAGGSSAFVRSIRPFAPADWHFAVPLPAQAEGAAEDRSNRALSLGPALRPRVVPERIQMAWRTWEYRRVLRARRPKLVYCHSNEVAMVNFLFSRGRVWPGAKFVIHQHGSENALTRATFRWARHGMFVRIYEQLQRAVHRRADLVVVIDEPSAVKNRDWGVENRLLRLPNAVDTDQFRPQPSAREATRAKLGISPGEFVFLHAARLEDVKRPSAIVEAFESMAIRDPQLHSQLVIAGEGTLSDEVRRKVAASPCSSSMKFLGFVKPAEIAAIYAAADCFVLASEFEGVPMALLESLASGTPAIAPSVGGIPTIVNPTLGILVSAAPPVGELASAMAEAISRPWERAAIREAVAGYGARRAVQVLDAAFQELCDGVRR